MLYEITYKSVPLICNSYYILVITRLFIVFLQLMKAPVASSGKENWQLVYALEKKTKLVDFEMFSDDCIMFLKNAGHLYLNVISFVSHSVQSIQVSFSLA